MTTADLKALLLRCLNRNSPMTEGALVIAAKHVFQTECNTSDVTSALRQLDDDSYVTTQYGDGISSTTYSLTSKGQHKAKTL